MNKKQEIKFEVVGGGRSVGRTLKAHIDSLKKLESYRTIGTVEEFKALKEKAEPKKPILRLCGDCQSSECVDCDKHVDRCPSCNGALYVESGKPHECCPNCGQKLDWSVEE